MHRIVVLAVPIILSNVTVPLVGIVDTAVMGRMATPDYLSATAVGAVIFGSVFWAFGFLRMGTSGLVAGALGANDSEAVRQSTWRALTVAAGLGLLIIALQKPILSLGLFAIKGSESLHQLTSAYFHIRILSAPATLAMYAIIGSLIGQQRMRSVLLVQVSLNVLNVVLTLALFQLTDWHIRGVAIASVIAEYAAVFLGLWMIRDTLFPITRITEARGLAAYAWLTEPEALSRFLVISRDIFLRTLLLTFAYYWLTAAGSRFGDTVLAANAILIQILNFSSHALDGFAHAAETLTGFAYGRRDRTALHSALRAASIAGVVMAALISAAYLISGESIIALLTTQPDVLLIANDYLLWIALAPLVGVAGFILDGVFIGTTRTRAMRNAMFVSVAIFLVMLELSTPLMGNHGLWFSYYVLLIARALTLGWKVPELTRWGHT